MEGSANETTVNKVSGLLTPTREFQAFGRTVQMKSIPFMFLLKWLLFYKTYTERVLI